MVSQVATGNLHGKPTTGNLTVTQLLPDFKLFAECYGKKSQRDQAWVACVFINNNNNC
jgi:hypothetical protein